MQNECYYIKKHKVMIMNTLQVLKLAKNYIDTKLKLTKRAQLTLTQI